MGRIDLSGYEKQPIRNDIREGSAQGHQLVESTLAAIEQAENLHAEDLSQIIKIHKNANMSLLDKFKALIFVLSNRISELWHTVIDKEYALEKLINKVAKENVKNWKQSRYAPAISFVTRNCSKLRKIHSGQVCLMIFSLEFKLVKSFVFLSFIFESTDRYKMFHVTLVTAALL